MTKKVDGGTVVIKGKADLKQIIDEGKKAGGALDQTKKSAQSLDRQLKGAARASSGASKNFSKMSQGITGGLVPAYATLAANLFALDAVFRFLKNSADFRVLKEGQLAFAAATGVAYQSLARDLQTATRGMINFRDAAQAGAIGRAAGLSAGQLRELSEAAFTVSVALGRDVTDSFNRLVRGVTKAEPELLDELGIVLRLEEATTKYAASLGLNKNQLSIYQKSQAVVNEVLDQAETKFGKINAIMEPQANSITQLGVAFEEAIDAMRPAIAAVAEFVANFGKKNIDVLIVAILGFAGGIINSVIPATHELRAAQEAQAEAYEQRLERLRIKQEQLRQSKLALANTPIAQQNLIGELDRQGISFGGQIGADLKSGKALSGQQIGNLKSQMTRNVGVFKGMSDAQKGTMSKILDDMKKDGGKMSKSMRLSLQQAGVELDIFKEKAGTFGEKVSGFFANAGRGVLAFVSTVGTLFAVGSIIFMIGKAIFNAFNKQRIEQAEKFNDLLKEQTKSAQRLNQELLKMGEVRRRGLVTGAELDVFLGNAVESTDINARLQDFQRLRAEAFKNTEGFAEYRAQLIGTFRRLSEIDDRFKQFGDSLERNGRLTEKQYEELNELQKSILTVKAAQDALKQSQGELIKENNRLIQSLPKIPYQNLIDLLTGQAKAYIDLVKEGKPYEDHLTAVMMKLQMLNYLQEQNLAIQKQQIALDMDSAAGFLFGDASGRRQLKVRQAELNFVKEIGKANDIIANIKLAEQSMDSVKMKSLMDQADLQAEMVTKAGALLDLEKLRADQMAMTVNTVYGNLEKDLGNAIGMAMRGDSSGFAKIGENMAKTVTDALGQMLSEQFLEDVMPDFLKPKSAGDEIITASQQHASKVKLAIAEGSFLHYGNIVDGSREGAQLMDQVLVNNAGNLQKILDQINKAEHGIATTEKEGLVGPNGTIENPSANSELGRAITERNNALELSTTQGVMNYIRRTGLNTDIATADAMNFAEGKMDIGDQSELFDLRASRGSLQAIDTAKMKLDPKDYFVVMQLADGTVQLVSQKEAQAYADAGLGSGHSNIFRNFAGPGSEAADFTYGRGHMGTQKFSANNAEHLARLINEEIADLNADESKMFKNANEDFANFLLGDTITQLGNVQTADAKIKNIKTEVGILDKKLAAFDPTQKPTFDSTTLTDPTSGSGIFLPDGTLNPEFVASFGGGVEKLKELINEAAGVEGGGTGGDGEPTTMDQFSKNLNQFSGVIGMMGALTGEEEKTAKIMAKVAQIQLIIAMYERAKMAFDATQGGGGTIGNILKTFFFGGTGARQGGIMSAPGYRSYATGGVAKGPNSGYGAVLHGTEAVVPLPNGRSIPVDIGKGKMSTNNTNITVNISDSGVSNNVDSDGGKELANVINMAVQERLEKEMRPGGILGA